MAIWARLAGSFMFTDNGLRFLIYEADFTRSVCRVRFALFPASFVESVPRCLLSQNTDRVFLFFVFFMTGC